MVQGLLCVPDAAVLPGLQCNTDGGMVCIVCCDTDGGSMHRLRSQPGAGMVQQGASYIKPVNTCPFNAPDTLAELCCRSTDDGAVEAGDPRPCAGL